MSTSASECIHGANCQLCFLCDIDIRVFGLREAVDILDMRAAVTVGMEHDGLKEAANLIRALIASMMGARESDEIE